MAAPTVVSVVPPPDATGVFLREPVEVLFDQEIDLDSLDQGGFVLAAPAYRLLHTGPTPFDYQDYLDRNFLTTNGFRGIISGTLSYERINLLDEEEYTGPDDTEGDGTLWRTKLIFSPTKDLESQKTYMAILGTMVYARTVFDIVHTGTGTGVISPKGPYRGAVEDTYTVTIDGSGTRNSAVFSWTRSSDGYTATNLTASRSYQFLSVDDNIQIKFGRGTYEAGDEFSFKVKPGVALEEIYGWSFQTGLVDTVAPTEEATIITGAEVVDSTVVGDTGATSAFYITSTNPESGSANMPLTTYSVIFRFSEDIDASTVIADESVYAEGFVVDHIWSYGDPDGTPAGDIPVSVSVTGDMLIVTLLYGGSGQELPENNEIRIWLTDAIRSTEGNSLDNYLYYFTTRYTPIYSDISQVMVKLGSVLGDQVPEDVIYRLLLRYSRMVDKIAEDLTVYDSTRWGLLRAEWVLCHTLVDILSGLSSSLSTGGNTKRLGDLSVRYEGGSASVSTLLKDAQACVIKLDEMMRISTVSTMLVAVKGAEDEEDYNPGRGIGSYSDPALPYVNEYWYRDILATDFSTARSSRKFHGNRG